MGFVVRHTVAPNGERHPLVVGDDGVPVWWPNIWLLTKHRNRGKAAGTLANYAYFLVRLYSWAENRGIQLDERMLSRNWLEEWELCALATELKVQVGVMFSRPRQKRGGNVEKFIAPVVSEATLVKNETAATRLHIVSDYLQWLGTEGVNRVSFDLREIHEKSLGQMIESLLDNVPICHKYTGGLGRGYDRAGVRRLIEISKSGHKENPFESPEIQLRNHLIVVMLFAFGMRVGELAALKVKDLDLHADVLSIERRPDDPEDPRGRYAPHQKTRPRVMRLEIGSLIQDYKKRVRNRYNQALYHPYLFVSEPEGAAISLAAIEKIFRELRTRVAGLPKKLTPHYLRHAWNYEWSLLCKEKGISKAQKDQMRKTLMGWSGESEQAERYDQAYIQEQADECSLEIQQHVLSMIGGGSIALERMRGLSKQPGSERDSNA